MAKKSEIEVKYAGKSQKELRKMRRDAAEEVCWQLLIAMQLDVLSIPVEERQWFASPIAKWSELAAATGVLRDA